ncbi:MAG: hypothetical protein ACE5JH_10835 [Acidobacteriota bacterium]
MTARSSRGCQFLIATVIFAVGSFAGAPVLASAIVPEVVDQPGSQPLEAMPSSTRCENCHGGSYDPAVEPGFNWRGSMMSHATRDPLFWATLDVAEQDFIPNLPVWNNLNPGVDPGSDPPGGVGDLCIRCHTPEGWIGGRSTPTDGSGLSTSTDFNGVSCDTCHRLMDPETAEARRTMSPGHEAYWINDQGRLEGFYGSAQYVLDPGGDKRGPYDDATSKSHGPIPSPFHRSGDLCGTCHDVSNPAVGHLAPNHGRLDGRPLPVNFCLISKAACADDAACLDCDAGQPACEADCGGVWDAVSITCDRRDTCRTTVAEAYPPYMYGVVERTYSEWKSSAWEDLDTATFLDDPAIPPDLKVAGGAPEAASRNAPYNSATDPQFNPPRRFTCQSCHMHSVTGQGCNKNPEVRTDLPLHDQTGGSTWMPLAMQDMSDAGTLVGGALPADQIPSLQAGIERARAQLRRAVKVDALATPPGGLMVRVTNLTGHKFLSGYPEGRRAWINVVWYDRADTVIHEDGAYDETTGALEEFGTRVYAAHPGISRDWAELLIAVGYDPSHPLTFDLDGNVTSTLGELASGVYGEYRKTFHFVLNNLMIEDRRIPPFGFDPIEAAERNAMTVPADAYRRLPNGRLQHWDDAVFPVPVGAARAEVQIYYQSTSREYINFLRRANTTTGRGEDLYRAWLDTGKAPPEPLVVADGVPAPRVFLVPACAGPPASVGASLTAVHGERAGDALLVWQGVPDATGYLVHRWNAPDRTGPEVVYDLAETRFRDAAVPPAGAILFYEVGSTTACGETSGEFSAGP